MKKPVKKAKPRKAKPVKMWEMWAVVTPSGNIFTNLHRTKSSAIHWRRDCYDWRVARVEIREI